MSKRTLTLLFLIVILWIGTCQAQFSSEIRNLKIPVPATWIEGIHNYTYRENNQFLIEEFEDFIRPDSLTGSSSTDHNGGGLLNILFVNLDNDAQEELIGLFGWSEEYPTLAVFKEIDSTWYLLFLEPFYMFYSAPRLTVENNYSSNKVFYINWLYERGSGIYCDALHFYKLIDNKVYPCLELINNARIFGWGMYLNQEIAMDFKLSSTSSDEFWVTYSYNFFPGAILRKDAPWDAHPELSLVDGEQGIAFVWDPLTYRYKPENYPDAGMLNEAKLSCFGDFGNDSLFISAFGYELQQTLENGTKQQKKLVKDYLRMYYSHHPWIPPSGELEEKAGSGNLRFYGIKKED